MNEASINGVSTLPAMATLETAGTTCFTIPPANDPEATMGMAGAASNAESMVPPIMPTLAGS